jgi:hypothetical protein
MNGTNSQGATATLGGKLHRRGAELSNCFYARKTNPSFVKRWAGGIDGGSLSASDFEGTQDGHFRAEQHSPAGPHYSCGRTCHALRPITESVPRYVVPVAGKPFLSHQLELLRRLESRRLLLLPGSFGEMVGAGIRQWVGDGVKTSNYSFDGRACWEQVGALKRLCPAGTALLYALRRQLS